MADIDLGKYIDDSIVQRDWWNPVTLIKAALQSGTTSINTLGVTIGTDGIVWGTDNSGTIGADAARPATVFQYQVNLKETTTPTAVPNSGQIYTKTDNEIYFQDGAGVEHTIFRGASDIRHLFMMPFEDPTGTVGNWEVVEINASQDVHFVFEVPESFETLDSAFIMVIPDATETLQWDLLVSVAFPGEAYNNDDRTAADETLAVTANNITLLDISGSLTGIIAGDFVAVDFQSDTANIRVCGLEFNYE